MASQEYIIDHEARVCEFVSTVKGITEALAYEVEANGSTHVDTRNRDCWGTLMVNCQDLHRRLDKLITKLNEAL